MNKLQHHVKAIVMNHAVQTGNGFSIMLLNSLVGSTLQRGRRARFAVTVLVLVLSSFLDVSETGEHRQGSWRTDRISAVDISRRRRWRRRWLRRPWCSVQSQLQLVNHRRPNSVVKSRFRSTILPVASQLHNTIGDRASLCVDRRRLEHGGPATSTNTAATHEGCCRRHEGVVRRTSIETVR